MASTASSLLDIVPTKAATIKKQLPTDFKAVVFESHKQKPQKQLENDVKFQNKQHKVAEFDSCDDDDCDEDGFSDGEPRQFTSKKRKQDDTEFDMKKARYEVMKFGISGFATKNKKKAEVALAVQLGAKAPKKPYKNYKDLLKEKKMAKELKQERRRLQQLGKTQTGTALVKYRKPKLQKKKSGTGELSRHYGVINPKIGKNKKK